MSQIFKSLSFKTNKTTLRHTSNSALVVEREDPSPEGDLGMAPPTDGQS